MTTEYLLFESREVLTVPHAVGHLAISPGERFLLAFHPDETRASLFTSGGRRADIPFDGPTRSLCMCISSDGKYLGYASDGSSELIVRDLDSGGEMAVPHVSDVVDARFDPKGRLWTARRETNGFVVEVRSPRFWVLLCSAQVSSAYFAQGGAEIRDGHDGQSMYVAAYSGQNEQENYYCTLLEGELIARHVVEMDGEQFVFAGSEYPTLTLDHMCCEIARFTEAGRCTLRAGWPDYDETDAEDERPGYHGCHLDRSYFLAGSENGRLFILRSDDLELISEVAVKGFEPVALALKYPSLSDVRGSGSDLRCFGRCGKHVYLFFAKNHRSSFQRLAVLAVSDLLKAAASDQPHGVDG